MKEKILALICSLLIYLFPNSSWAASHISNYVEAGRTEVGSLYINLDNIQTVRKNNEFFLITSVEERYTDQKFLADIRQSEGLEKAVGMLTLYVFDNHGASYAIARQYIYDQENNICLDLGSNMQMQNVGTDRNLLNLYEVSLKSIERKQKSSTNRWIK